MTEDWFGPQVQLPYHHTAVRPDSPGQPMYSTCPHGIGHPLTRWAGRVDTPFKKTIEEIRVRQGEDGPARGRRVGRKRSGRQTEVGGTRVEVCFDFHHLEHLCGGHVEYGLRKLEVGYKERKKGTHHLISWT